MTNLHEYYKNHFDEKNHGYYLRLEKEIKRELKAVQPFSEPRFISFDEVLCEIVDSDDAIDKWKTFLLNAVDSNEIEDDIEFLLTSFYLLHKGYHVVEHPRLLKNIKSRYKVIDELKTPTSSKYGNRGISGGVKYEDRKEYVRKLTVEMKGIEGNYTIDDLEELLARVSLNNHEFKNKPLNEQLFDLRSVYENLTIKDNGKFDSVDFEGFSDGYVSSKMAHDFTNKLHAFRHAKDGSLIERDSYSDDAKKVFC